MPSGAAILKYLTTVILPPAAGALATWLVVHVHLLGTLGVSQSAVASAILAVAVFAVTTLVTVLTQHHILAEHYPAISLRAKASPPPPQA